MILSSIFLRRLSLSVTMKEVLQLANLCQSFPKQTRLNAFTHSCLFNATAVAAQCHSQQTNSQSLARVTTKCAMYSFQPPPQNINRGPSPHLGTAMQTPFSPLSFGKSLMKIRSAVPENGCLVFLWRTGKKTEKTPVKHICIHLIGG